MRLIAHLSDLHFGCLNETVLSGLLAELALYGPSPIIISGDIVQRTSPHHFHAAKRFLSQLPGTVFIVPGNHDLPVYNLFARFTDPFRRYRQYICDDLAPIYSDDDLMIIGITSPRAWTLNFTEGFINTHQLHHLSQSLQRLPTNKFKILVIHHSFLPPLEKSPKSLPRNRKKAIPMIAQAGVDLVLSGHLHRYCVADAAAFHGFDDYSLLVAQASTTTSTRLRHDHNGYTLITIDSPQVTFKPRFWNGCRFDTGSIEVYQRHRATWKKLDPLTPLTLPPNHVS